MSDTQFVAHSVRQQLDAHHCLPRIDGAANRLTALRGFSMGFPARPRVRHRGGRPSHAVSATNRASTTGHPTGPPSNWCRVPRTAACFQYGPVRPDDPNVVRALAELGPQIRRPRRLGLLSTGHRVRLPL